jgi:(4S)-4-hydroxy-5-phosphonooxypentane-2,3-dione isomerase
MANTIDPMYILVVNILIKPEYVDAFREATIENATNSRNEPGVARFDLLQQTDDATRFVLVEAYRDHDAIAAHKLTAHYLAWAEKVADMFAEPRARALYQNVDPADSGW